MKRSANYSKDARQVMLGMAEKCSVASTSNAYVTGGDLYINYENVSVVKQRTIVIKNVKESESPSTSKVVYS